jgi:hypothetical protein
MYGRTYLFFYIQNAYSHNYHVSSLTSLRSDVILSRGSDRDHLHAEP